jgi:small multidrug resistance family-3 protein
MGLHESGQRPAAPVLRNRPESQALAPSTAANECRERQAAAITALGARWQDLLHAMRYIAAALMNVVYLRPGVGRMRRRSGAQKVLIVKTFLLFVLTAVAEILGCYLPYLWLRRSASAWLLLPAAFSLAVFSWLLTLHPAASGRVYAAYGGVYIVMALVWLWRVDGVPMTRWDLAGGAVALAGMGIIVWGGWRG